MYQTLDIAQIERRNADYALNRAPEYIPRDIYNEQQEHREWSTQYNKSQEPQFEAMSGQVNDTFMPMRSMKAIRNTVPLRGLYDEQSEMINARINALRADNNNIKFPTWLIWAPIGIIILLILTFIMVTILVFKK